MASRMEMHLFLGRNLPGHVYDNMDFTVAFILEQMHCELSIKEVFSQTQAFRRFREFLVGEWLGNKKIRVGGQMLAKEFEPETPEETAKKAEAERRKLNFQDMRGRPKNSGVKCTCGGRLQKRYSPKTDNFFMGCTNYPKCKITKPL